MDPSDCYIWSGKILGIDILHGYWDTEDQDFRDKGLQVDVEDIERLEEITNNYDRYETSSRAPGRRALLIELFKNSLADKYANPKFAYAKRCREAVEWFERHAEDLLIWT